MAQHAMVKVASDVFVNFYEVASVESTDEADETLIVLKNGHKIVLGDTTPSEVNQKIVRHISGDNAYRVGSYE